ncbi:MAG: hypothetical protein ACKN89_00570 [Cyanobium sp.]|jgi:hypothetical protein|nr:hypothetical protein [Synechococcaceae cyanobacterium]
MIELLVFLGTLGLLVLAWSVLDSDDDNSGGGLMQPVLLPVRSQPRR